jgi:hypothetical protein
MAAEIAAATAALGCGIRFRIGNGAHITRRRSRPLIAGEKFTHLALEEEVARKLRLERPEAPWAADRELWSRRDVPLAKLMDAQKEEGA